MKLSNHNMGMTDLYISMYIEWVNRNIWFTYLLKGTFSYNVINCGPLYLLKFYFFFLYKVDLRNHAAEPHCSTEKVFKGAISNSTCNYLKWGWGGE